MGACKHFTPEFKREAVQLVESGTRPASEIARELGIARHQLYKWQTELRARGPGAFPGSGARRMWWLLKRVGEPCGRHRVARLRRMAGIVALRRQR